MVNKEDSTTNEGLGIVPEELQIPTLATKDETKIDEEEKEAVGKNEEKELSEEELKELYIEQLKKSKITFHPLRHPVKTVGITKENRPIGGTRIVKEKATITNVTTNLFDKSYKQKRKRKNKLTKASRRANRKK